MADNVSELGQEQAEVVPQHSDRKFSQADVNEIVRTAKDKTAYASYRKGIEDGKSQSGAMGGMSQLTPAQIEQQIRAIAPQVLQEHAHKMQVDSTVQTFLNKLSSAKDRFPDLEDRLGKYDMSRIGPVLALSTKFDNTADILDDLDKNPHKIVELMNIHSINKDKAEDKMRLLSSSIRANLEGAKTPKHTEPLSQIHTSPVGAGDGTQDESLEAFKNASWLQGF